MVPVYWGQCDILKRLMMTDYEIHSARSTPGKKKPWKNSVMERNSTRLPASFQRIRRGRVCSIYFVTGDMLQ